EGKQILYSLKELPQPSYMDQLCEKWRPYWSVVAWYLWRFVEAKGTPSSAARVMAGASLQQQQQHQGESQHPHQLQLMDPLNMLNIG
ncbi:hypothetical protein UlMin_037850, partial [Ulmus minor]